jgi:septal ring factor EnvC (AmiA/AmiB activator)
MRVIAASLLLLALVGAAEGEREAVQRRLAELRAELQGLRAERERLARDEAAALAAVEEADRAVATSLVRERELEEALVASEARLAQATAELVAHRQAIAAESGRLAAIARLAFLLGRDAARVQLLVPERAQGRARALAALAYLKVERSRLIARLRVLADEAALLITRAEAEGKAIETRREALRAERAELERARREQHERGRRLRELLEAAEARASALDREAAALGALLERLADVFADLPPFMAGASLADRRGALLWPVSGEVIERFGSRDELGRPRRGLWISAPEGSPVRAVAHGRVAFADWLPGLGLLLVVDHGDGFLSLYGHLGASLVEAGEWVEEGQTVALLGRSGGIDQAKLHFEIRRQGQALDPLSWLSRGGGRRR